MWLFNEFLPSERTILDTTILKLLIISFSFVNLLYERPEDNVF